MQFRFNGDRLQGLIGAYYFSQDQTARDIREVSEAQQGLARANWFAEFQRMQGLCAANFLCESMAPFFGSTIVVPRDVNALSIENTAVFGLVSFQMADTKPGVDLGGPIPKRGHRAGGHRAGLGRSASGAGGDGCQLRRLPAPHHPGLAPDAEQHALSRLRPRHQARRLQQHVAIEAGIPTFAEEDVDSIEIGAKNTLADGQVTANFAAFFNQVEGYQLTQNVRSGQNTTSATVNAGDADILGLEAEIQARPQAAEGLTLTLNYAWTDTEFQRGFDQNQGVLLDVADDGMINCSTGDQFPEVDGCTSLFGDVKGKRIPRTAKHQLFADAEMRRPFANGDWRWFIGANFAYESSKFAQVHNEAKTGDATMVNLRLGLVSDRYSIRVWGRNLTGEDTAYTVLRYAERKPSGATSRWPHGGTPILA